MQQNKLLCLKMENEMGIKKQPEENARKMPQSDELLSTRSVNVYVCSREEFSMILCDYILLALMQGLSNVMNCVERHT